MKRLFLCLLLGVFLQSTAAQVMDVKGIVHDDKQIPVSYCNVAFSSLKNGELVVGCITDADGRWNVKIASGSYSLEVSFIGYTSYKDTVDIQTRTELPSIILTETANELQELVVTGQNKVRTASSDTYYLAESPKTIGRNALEVVSLAAGVSIDKRKGLKIYGKEGVKVMMNNRPIDLTGEELIKYIANLRGEDIKKVEVVSLADASRGGDALGGVIKITLKSRAVDGYDMSVGVMGQSYGTTFLGVKPDVSFNSKFNKFNVYGNLHYSSIGERETDRETSQYLETNKGLSTQTEVDYKQKVDDWFYRLGVVYDIDDKQSLGMDIDGAFSRSKEEMHTPSIITNNEKLRNFYSDYYRPDSISKFNLSLHYHRLTDDLGSELSVGADFYSSFDNSSEHNRLYSTDPGDDFLVETQGITQYSQRMYTSGVDYKWVLSPAFTLNMGAKFNFTRMKNDLNNRMYQDGKWGVDVDNTDNYSYDETILAGYANGTLRQGKWNLMAGVRYESTIRDMTSQNFPERVEKKTYHDFFPVVSATYNWNEEKGHSFTLKAKTGVTRPSFAELIPFSTQQNLYTFITGNPFLTPSYVYSVGADVLLFRGLYFGFDFTRKKDAVELVLQQRETNELIVDACYQNIPRMDSYMLNGYVPLPICDWLYAGIELAGGKKKREVGVIKDDIWLGFVGLEANITIARDWNLELYGSYVNKEFYGNMLLKKYYTADASLKRSFMNKKLQIALNAENVFGKRKNLEVRDSGIHRDVYMKGSDEAARFTFSIRYTFGGKNKVQIDRIKATNATERER